uniref:Uncharacterized protein n=1 Tax=Arundo donax TaxID=35708 RepID=A0A0A9I3R4_ARUDO
MNQQSSFPLQYQAIASGSTYKQYTMGSK